MAQQREVVFAFFKSQPLAHEAVEALKAWDEQNKQIKLHAMAILVLDEAGYVKVHKVGARRGIGKGVGVGAVTVAVAGSIINPLVLPTALGMLGATRKSL